MMQSRISFLLFLSTFITAVLHAQSPQKLKKTVDSIIQTAVHRELIPGAVIQIKKGNTIIYRNAFGFAERNGDDNKPLAQPVPMTTDCLFDIASLTKVVGTTTAVMLLVDRGLIRVEDRVGKYIPAFNTADTIFDKSGLDFLPSYPSTIGPVLKYVANE